MGKGGGKVDRNGGSGRTFLTTKLITTHVINEAEPLLSTVRAYDGHSGVSLFFRSGFFPLSEPGDR